MAVSTGHRLLKTCLKSSHKDLSSSVQTPSFILLLYLFIFFKDSLIILCTRVMACICVGVWPAWLVPTETRTQSQIPWTRVAGGCEPTCGRLELNSGLLLEQQVLLTSEPSFQPRPVIGKVSGTQRMSIRTLIHSAQLALYPKKEWMSQNWKPRWEKFLLFVIIIIKDSLLWVHPKKIKKGDSHMTLHRPAIDSQQPNAKHP